MGGSGVVTFVLYYFLDILDERHEIEVEKPTAEEGKL